ncbi:Bug family tripartite tricarboxylate transporter substrate binding protein [Muricoccus pecuniae]|uniref:Tripartite-type tricarboxylate transporter receptor subunit TctC n=1 Tax=Muricoccus pecuniae TaxID=693023 RepID=A0A840XTJ4_9PROT|nr:tripartite tricarboxylate transporter substrate-binding protein [Roseomonas pecuniae]MBB5692018.1 tripartite-type tricarboxylate transporter receptor subunit TctC [Roseomonas pecuniae]
MKRRDLLRTGLAATAALAAPAVHAQNFDHTLRIIVPNAPGGTSDILARLIAPELTRALGQNVVVENRAGAGGNIGADVVAKSPPDGHTLLLMDVTTIATNPALFPRLPFDNAKDLAPVTMLIYAPYILGVANALPVQDAAGLAAFAKSSPRPLNGGNSGVGTASHLTLIELADAWGKEMTHVPYRGGAPALTAVVSGEADLTIAGATQAQPYAVNNQMRAVAVTGTHRLSTLPNVPTFRELGWPAADAGTWQGIMVQGNTPRPLVERLHRELRAIVALPPIAARLADLGAEPRTEGPDAFRQWLTAQTETYTRLIRANNVRLD